jgi:hypothetical protein
VPTLEDKQGVEEAAKTAAPGVRVVNNLTVSAAAAPATRMPAGPKGLKTPP